MSNFGKSIRTTGWWSARGRSTVGALALLALSHSAFAAETFKQRVGALTKTVDNISEQAEALTQAIAPGRGILSEEMAVLRYEDALYSYVLGDHSEAAEALFSLVASGVLVDPGLHEEAEWYLSESLRLMGNVETAIGQYQSIAANSGHFYREYAVRRLLQAYAETGKSQLFYEVYKGEIVSGKVEPSPLVSYTVAKAFYAQDEWDEAVRQFQRIPEGSAWYARAQYFLGTISVVREDWDGAVGYFESAAAVSPTSDEGRQVMDLALLAIGRVNYEVGRYEEASSAYARISGDSDYLADKLYEAVWVFVKQERWPEALRAVEVFLLSFPEHEYTARLRLLEGHLHLQQDQFEPALVSYEGVIEEYTPVRDRFSDLSGTLEEPERYFQRVLDISRGELSDDRALPAYAVAMMLADQELSRSITVYEQVVDQREIVEESEAIIAEIEEALSRSESLGGFGNVGYEATTQLYRTLRTELDVMILEEDWLKSNSPNRRFEEEIGPLVLQRESIESRLADAGAESGDASGSVAALSATDRQRIELTAEVRELREEAETLIERSTSDQLDEAIVAEASLRLEQVEETLAEKGELLASLGGPLEDAGAPSRGGSGRSGEGAWATEVSRELLELRKQYSEYRPGGATGQAALTVARFDGMYSTLQHNTEMFIEVLDRVRSAQSDEMNAIRERFAAEVGRVSKQRSEVDAASGKVQTVAVDLTRAGFGRLEEFFAEALLGADVGIVDVFWSEKLQTGERRERLAEERNELIRELESRFTLIRSKLGEGRQ